MSSVVRLIQILDAQLGNYEVLHDLLARKRAAIEANDLQALAKAAGIIEQVIGENNRLEAQRQEIAVQLLDELGIPDHRPTLARIARRLSPADRALIEERRDSLRLKLAELRQEVQTIRSVLQLNLHLTDQLIQTMLSVIPGAATYEPDGLRRERETLRLLDRTV